MTDQDFANLEQRVAELERKAKAAGWDDEPPPPPPPPPPPQNE